MLFRTRLLLCLVLLALLAGIAPIHAKEQGRIEVVPNIPHANSAQTVAFSRDGTRVASGSRDKTVKLWDVRTGALLRTLNDHGEWVFTVAFSPDGSKVASGAGDDTIKLWDAATGELLRTIEETSMVRSVAFSPDGASVLSGSDGGLQLWDVATGAKQRSFEGHGGAVRAVAFSADGSRLLSGSEDKTVRLWDAATGTLLQTFEGHTAPVRSVAFSPDGARLLSGGNDKTVRLWDAASGTLLRSFEGHSSEVNAVAFAPDGTIILSGGGDDTITVWDADAGSPLRSIDGQSARVAGVAFSADTAQALSAGENGTIRLRDTATGALLQTLGGHAEVVLHGEHDGVISSVAVSPDATRILSGSDADRKVRLWDATSGALLRTFEGHADAVSSVAFSLDGSRVLSGGHDGAIRLWDARSGAVIRTMAGGPDRVRSFAFSSEGASVLSGSIDATVKLWSADKGSLLRTFKGHPEWVWSVALSADGRRVLSGGVDGTLLLWNAATGARLRTLNGHTAAVASVAFSPDGRRALSGGLDDTVMLWDTATGKLLRTIDGPFDWVWSVAFSPDGTRVLTGSGNKAVTLWDANTGARLRTYEGHLQEVSSVAFAPNGQTIVSSSSDTTTRIWDASTGAQRATLFAGRDGRWLALTPAGFFASSPLANDLLAIVRGFDVITIDQVHQSLYNPDLVREAMAGDPDGEVAKAAEVMNLEKVLQSGPAPNVIVKPRTEGGETARDLVTVDASVEDRGKGVGRIEWRVNGITAAIAVKPPGSGPFHSVSRELALDAGDNVIEVVAYNGSNLLASLPARATVKFTGPADTIKPKLHILAIGINAYADQGWGQPGGESRSYPRLGLAVADATAFADSMTKASAGLYDEVRVTLALDKDATRENLDRLVGEIAAQVHPRDSFILFAAAHGDAENGRFYLIPQDYQSGPKGTLAKRAVGQDDLQDWLANRIKARKAIVLLDTCESGALIAGYKRSRIDGAASEAGVGRLHEATGRPVLTAAAAGQSAGEGPIAGSHEGHGYFTWAVLDALRFGDSNGDGLIELSELAAHVQAVVPKVAAGIVVRAATSAAAYEKQTARFGSRGEDFAIARALK